LAVFALLVLYSSLRYAALPSQQIRSGDAENANREQGFLLPK